MSRFAVSDVDADVPSGNGDSGGSTSAPKAMAPSGEDEIKMDYLSVGGGVNAKSNVDRNQLTVTSTASGNMALYYEVSHASLMRRLVCGCGLVYGW